jgi:hypothetical protein
MTFPNSVSSFSAIGQEVNEDFFFFLVGRNSLEDLHNQHLFKLIKIAMGMNILLGETPHKHAHLQDTKLLAETTLNLRLIKI